LVIGFAALFGADLVAGFATAFAGAAFFTVGFAAGFGATLVTGFAADFDVARDPRFATGLAGDFTAGFAAAFAVGFTTGFGVGLAAGFGAAFVTGFAAAFGATLVDAAFTGATFTGVPTVTLLTCFAFVTCSPPLPL
jgi:hypothetical protein